MSAPAKFGIGGLTVVLVIAALLALSGWRPGTVRAWKADLPSSQNTVGASPVPAVTSDVSFASPGRVEGSSENTQIGAAQDGVLKAVYVKEGQFVVKGSLLAEIACDDLKASLQTSLAQVQAAQQMKVRLLGGTRVEERRVAEEKTKGARANFEQTKSRLGMISDLYDKEEVSREKYELAVRDMKVADAEFEAALRAEELLAAPPLTEDQARADAEISSAEGSLHAQQERVRKCAVRAPINATVLRVYAKPGESFSMVTPRSLFTLVDASARRVRAEVDERDVYKVSVGQRVLVEADALGEKKLNGTVEWVSVVMGRKTIFTGDPSDKSDRDILEALIRLDTPASSLPIGLRVTVRFLASDPEKRDSGAARLPDGLLHQE